MHQGVVPILNFIAFFGTIAACVIGVRFATARIKRMEAPPQSLLSDQAVEELREELDAMQERIDFLERALLAQKDENRRVVGEAEHRS
jgi:hypothetical protein